MAHHSRDEIENATLSFNPFDGDFGEPGDTVLSNKMVVARKEGPCSHCGSLIFKGERVRSMSAKFGDFMRYRWCASCCDVMAAVYLHDEADEDDEDAADPLAVWESRAANRAAQAVQGHAS
ncbi:hypothetical protein N5C67_10320 [Comamonas thiooxydans]|uniref:hypothetical protein n=1 Tax=Comamonas thiooxydans TaxID=363952 RepID=UPI00244BEE61|nr:hypothetical protein [Comamonas thiooxydans]MDH1253047.1 hypothetical protein [Comamonas thiooxydans]